MVGGGGYTIRNVSRCWTYETAVALGSEIANELPYNDYFEYFGPDFKLHISPSNMTNTNASEYLEKIKNRLFENLRMLPHAPGVQIQGEFLSNKLVNFNIYVYIYIYLYNSNIIISYS